MVHVSRAGFGGGVTCSDYVGGLLEESGEKVCWEVGWDVGVWDRGGPSGLSTSEEE